MRSVWLFPFLLAACSGSDDATAPASDDSAVDSSTAEETAPVDSSPTDDVAMADSSTTAETEAETAPPPMTTPYVYVGEGNGQIEQFAWDAKTGTLTKKASFGGSSNPSFLAVDPSTRYLFAVDEDASRVVAYSIAKGTGALTKLNDVDSGGGGPAYVSVDATGKSVLVANYGGGTVSVFPIQADGKLGAKSDGDAPGDKAHSFLAGPTNAFAYAPTLGANVVAQYALDAAGGTITPLTPAKVTFPANTGPRHMAFHPSGKFAFVIGETASTMSSLALGADGKLAIQQTLSTLPSGFSGTNTGADVHVHSSGKFLYGSNRGHDSIAVFDIGADGKLSLKANTKTDGNTPRNFHLDPGGQVMLVANQTSKTVVTFSIAADGTLTKLKSISVSGQPAYVGVVLVPT
ncbi:MAG: lactonase family protein [Polyangiales bacterium]